MTVTHKVLKLVVGYNLSSDMAQLHTSKSFPTYNYAMRSIFISCDILGNYIMRVYSYHVTFLGFQNKKEHSTLTHC